LTLLDLITSSSGRAASVGSAEALGRPRCSVLAFGRFAMKDYLDASGRLSIEVGEDGPLFRVYASRTEALCKGRRIRQLDGLDQRYWDYEIDGTTVVLHSDVFAGILLHVEDGSRDDLLRSVAAKITEPSASPNGGPATPVGNSEASDGPPSVS